MGGGLCRRCETSGWQFLLEKNFLLLKRSYEQYSRFLCDINAFKCPKKSSQHRKIVILKEFSSRATRLKKLFKFLLPSTNY